MIKAYFFDWMDTLAYVEGGSNKIEEFLGERHELLLTNSLKKIDFSEKEKNIIYSILNKEQHHLYTDSEKIIKNLREGYKLAIISNLYNITGDIIKNLFPDFIKNFDVTAFSCDVGIKKPDEKIFLYTLAKLNEEYGINIKLNEVMMIGDKINKDITPALKLGMQAKIINRKKQNLEDLIW